jgi:hypothetical protein
MVELPMKLYIDNKSAVDLANNWSIQGKLRHVGIKKKYIKENDQGTVNINVNQQHNPNTIQVRCLNTIRVSSYH